MINMAGVLRSGLDNPATRTCRSTPSLSRRRGFAAALGATHLEELDLRRRGPHRVRVPRSRLRARRPARHAARHGLPRARHGAAGRQPPPPRTGAGAAADPDVVRDALRNLRLPHELAAAPLARGDAARSARRRSARCSRTPPSSAFGDTRDERLMRRVLVRGYLDPAASHEPAADELNLSRAAYFRRLKQASERLAEYLRLLIRAVPSGPGPTLRPSQACEPEESLAEHATLLHRAPGSDPRRRRVRRP